MRCWILTLLFLSPMLSALTLEDLQHRFTQQPIVRAHFEQVRQIKEMPQPLRSAGEMIIARDTGLLWQQTHPFRMQLILDQNRMVQRIQDQPAQVITADSNPQMFQFNSLLTALFQADRRVLEKNFHLEFVAQEGEHWQLRLTPMTTPLDKIFASITLTGEKYLDHITLRDKLGDSTEITFSQHRLTPPVLSHDEQQKFSH